MLSFEVDTPTASKNNRQLVRTKGGKLKSLPNQRARCHKARIRGAALMALDELMVDPGELFGDDDIEVVIEHDVVAERCRVQVSSLGPRPEGKTGRGRDVDNFASTIMDALNEVAYADDRQVARLLVRRVYGGEQGR